MNRKTLPVGGELAKELVAYFDLKQYSNLVLPKLLTILKAKHRDEVDRYLRTRFRITDEDSRYKSVLSLPIKNIFTTNIDNLIPKLMSDRTDKYLNDISVRGPVLDRVAVSYFPLHGSIDHPTADFKFTTEELVTASGTDPDRWRYFSKELQLSPTIFWGYSLEDAGVIEALSPTWAGKPNGQAPRWIVVRKSDEATIDYFTAQGFHIIEAETHELLDYFVKFEGDNKNVTRVAGASTKTIFPAYAIPAPEEVPKRPIVDFLSGDNPEWSDIYSGLLHRTHHYDQLKNFANSKKHCLFLGLPGSGKSTLLKQLATDFNFQGHKLYMSLLSREKVHAISNSITDQNLLIFVDDFTDDVEAFTDLMELPRVQIIACARDFNFETVAHLIDQSHAKVFDVSELNDFDVQAIFDRIPSAIRQTKLDRPATGKFDSTVSFFELVESNVRTPTLRKRMGHTLDLLEREEHILADVLVATAYVCMCGVPMTIDMLHAFLRPHKIQPLEVQSIVIRLGSLLKEYSGIDSDSDQDNFVLRSKIMADAVFQVCSQKNFKIVYEQFHDEVSPYRTCRFDVFRRRAYDERFVSKAFSNWEEGLRFYEEAFNSDGSPELLQQGALFLSKRRQFSHAFKWIDRAKTMRPKSFSIRNTHAIIMFKANFELAKSDSLADQSLAESMRILAECYRDDKRKSYHAVTYAQHALDLATTFDIDYAAGYLASAKNWLEQELKEQPWQRNINNLLNKLRQFA